MAGSRKGIPNKDTRELLQKAFDLDVDPFEILLLYAKRDWVGLGYPSERIKKMTMSGEVVEVDVISPELQLSAAEKACAYLYPKRKSVEVSAHGNGLLETLMALDPEERKRRIADYNKQLGKPKA